MVKKDLIVEKELLSAREVSKFIRLAMAYQSSLVIECESCRVNPKSMMGMIYLGLRPGMKITIASKGPDEKQAAARLAEYLTEPAPVEEENA